MLNPIESFIVKPNELDQLRDQEKLNEFLSHMRNNGSLDVIGIAKLPYNQTVTSELPHRSIKSFIDIAERTCNISGETLSHVNKTDKYNFSFIDGMMATSVTPETLTKILGFYKPINNLGSQLLYDRGNKLLIDDSFVSSIEIVANVLNENGQLVQVVQFPISVEAYIQTMPVYPYITDVSVYRMTAQGLISKQYPVINDWLLQDQKILDLFANVALTSFRRTALYHLAKIPHLFVLKVSGEDLYAIVPNEDFAIKNPIFFGISLSNHRLKDEKRWTDYILFKTESERWCGVKFECSLKNDENLRTYHAHSESLSQIQLTFGSNEQTNAFFIGAVSESDLPKEII